MKTEYQKKKIRVIVHCSYILANCAIFINHLTEDRSCKKTIDMISIQSNKKEGKKKRNGEREERGRKITREKGRVYLPKEVIPISCN